VGKEKTTLKAIIGSSWAKEGGAAFVDESACPRLLSGVSRKNSREEKKESEGGKSFEDGKALKAGKPNYLWERGYFITPLIVEGQKGPFEVVRYRKVS